MQGKELDLASTAGQALGQFTQSLLNAPKREGSQLQAALSPSITALSDVGQQAMTKWGDAFRQYLQQQASPPALPWEVPAPASSAPSVIGIDGQPVPGVTTTTVPALTVPTSALPALTNGVVSIIDPSDPTYEQYAQTAAAAVTPLTPVSADVVAFDRVDFTPRLAPSLGRDNSAERRRKYTAAAAGIIATAAASHIIKARAAAKDPQVDAAGGPLIKHILQDKKEAATVPVPVPAAAAAQPVVVMPQPAAAAAIPTTTAGGITLHTSTPVSVSAPISVSTPVEQKSVQTGGGKGWLGH
ncbi:hypothetical protein COO60DRAFT_1626432 [Scenedesmus sp. NREL 46B-D3]|nr:hypothetical protein COO60DRAFT_1626432 [Scenedesmus sp. NREL 46B-D3]